MSKRNSGYVTEVHRGEQCGADHGQADVDGEEAVEVLVGGLQVADGQRRHGAPDGNAQLQHRAWSTRHSAGTRGS